MLIRSIINKILKYSPVALTKNQLYDKQTKKIIDRLSIDSNCIDAGCLKGEILDMMIDASPEGTHFGFEPLPELFRVLSNKYKRRKNCRIYNYALSNKNETTSFNHVITNPSYSGLKRRSYDRPAENDSSVQVQTKKLDDVIPANIQIDLIKIDVEGAELLVLQGAESIISQSQPLIIFEHGLGASDHYNYGPEELYEYFNSMNMKISLLGDFIRNKHSLSLDEFKKQYYNKINYYFIAHS